MNRPPPFRASLVSLGVAALLLSSCQDPPAQTDAAVGRALLDSLGSLDEGFEYLGPTFLSPDLLVGVSASREARMERTIIVRAGPDGEWNLVAQVDRQPLVSSDSPVLRPPSAVAVEETAPEAPEAVAAGEPSELPFPLPEEAMFDEATSLVAMSLPPSGEGRWGDFQTLYEFSYPADIWSRRYNREIVEALEGEWCLLSHTSPGGRVLRLGHHFAAPEQSDWAMACWNNGISYVRVVWGGPEQCSETLGEAPATDFLVEREPGVAGFGRALELVSQWEVESFLWRHDTEVPFHIEHSGIRHGVEGDTRAPISYCHDGEWVELAPRSSTLEEASVREGACPFECCRYGTWWATSAVPVYAEPSLDAAVVHTLQAGDTVQALTGQVQLVPTPLVWTAEHTTSEGNSYLPGDTVYVLESLGESRYYVWSDGVIYFDELSFLDSYPKPPAPPAGIVGERQTRWWARIRTEDGLEGWVDGYRMQGSDGCG